MGKTAAKRDAQQQMQEERTQAQKDRDAAVAAREPLRQRIAARRASIDRHEYNNAPDFVGNNAVAAETNRRMENQSNLTSTGIAGLATKYASADSVAMASRLLKDRQAQVTGAQFESDVGDYIHETNAMEQDSTNADQGLYSNFYNASKQAAWRNQQLYADLAMQSANMIPQMIGMGLQGASTVMGGYMAGRH